MSEDEKEESTPIKRIIKALEERAKQKE